jgi:SAM-dependent methyltransferase
MKNNLNFKNTVASILRNKGKYRFISELHDGAKVLDIGCGNASVLAFKQVNPSIKYTGVDIGDYYQTEASKNMMDQYHIFDDNTFAIDIDTLDKDYDAVVSSHNIEHCSDPNNVLLAMLSRLKPGGKIYLSFPSSESAFFPSRLGTLNYYDDSTHKNDIPNYNNILEILESKKFNIIFKTKNYRPFFLWFVGMLIEPISNKRKTVMTGTWEYYGFESIIHASKIQQD